MSTGSADAGRTRVARTPDLEEHKVEHVPGTQVSAVENQQQLFP